MKINLLLTLLLLLTASCTVTKPMVHPRFEPIPGEEIDCFEPLSFIYKIEKGDRMEYCDSLSYEVSGIVTGVIADHPSLSFLSEKIIQVDPVTHYECRDEIIERYHQAKKQKSLDNLPALTGFNTLMHVNDI